MEENASIQDDLLLIMQSYVDVPPQPVKAERQPLAKPVAVEYEDSDEDEVELAIQIEQSDDEGNGHFRRIKSQVKTPSIANPSSDDSDSDLSDSSCDVKMRVTKYPTRKQPAFQVSNDSDVEDDEGAPPIAQYAGTKNEVVLPEVKPPELAVVPPEEVLELIGEVMTVIDSVVVIKGYTSGVDRVLDTDSLLVFEDRNVFGVVFETFGAVKQPLYSVRFPSASVIDKDAIRVGRQVFHVPTRSNFVFTNEIARFKGSDASNLHDEEVGDDQLDFSDDEAEAQWRRNRKEAKRGQASLHDPANPVHEGTPKQPKLEIPASLPYPVADDGDVPYSTLPYDDVPDPRPAPAAYDPYLEHDDEVPTVSTAPQTSTEPSGSRGRARDRGRRRGSPNQHRNERHNDDRGRPRRGRGGRARGRGDRRQGRGGGNFSDQYPTDYYPDPSSMMYAMANATGQYPYVPQEEGYNPVNGGYWDQGAMPHINPRFFSGELGAGANAGLGMQWPSGQGLNYGYQQPGYEYGGYNHQNEEGYNHNYGNSAHWTPDGQSYTSRNHEHSFNPK